MDKFDKLFADKVNQNIRTDQDQAWNDFQSYRKSQSKIPKTTSNIKIWVRNFAILFLVSISSAWLGYQFAHTDIEPNLANKSINYPQTSMVRLHPDLTFNPILSYPKSAPRTTQIPLLKKNSQNNTLVAKSTVKDVVDINTTIDSNADKNIVLPVYESSINALNLSENPNFSSSISVDKGTSVSSISLNNDADNSLEGDKLNAVSLNETPSSINQIEAKMSVVSSRNPSGKVKKNRKNALKTYMSTFKHYTDVSLLSLDNSADIASIYHAQFLQNPANTGCENRYSITSGVRASFYNKEDQLFKSYENELFVANSFTLANNKIGVGIAINHATSPSANVMNLFVSSAYNFTLSKNQHLRVGIGLNSSTIELPQSEMRAQDYNLIHFNLGTRYEYKTLFAQLYVNNFAPITEMESGLYPNSTSWQFSFGGRLLLSKKWALHPEMIMGQLNTGFEIGSKIGFSYRNKWLLGLQTDDYKSLGLHAGASFGKRLTVLLKTDFFGNNDSFNRISERGSLLIKLELGKFKR